MALLFEYRRILRVGFPFHHENCRYSALSIQQDNSWFILLVYEIGNSCSNHVIGTLQIEVAVTGAAIQASE